LAGWNRRIQHRVFLLHACDPDIGDDGKKNNDIAAEYQVPLAKGIPALAVLDADGKLVYSQKNGEWESARSMDPADIITFLDKWKP